jgi:hypothetical protein
VTRDTVGCYGGDLAYILCYLRDYTCALKPVSVDKAITVCAQTNQKCIDLFFFMLAHLCTKLGSETSQLIISSVCFLRKLGSFPNFRGSMFAGTINARSDCRVRDPSRSQYDHQLCEPDVTYTDIRQLEYIWTKIRFA